VSSRRAAQCENSLFVFKTVYLYFFEEKEKKFVQAIHVIGFKNCKMA
jgi:hypothetical protein